METKYESKDFDGVKKNYNKFQPEEHLTVNYLNKTMPDAVVRSGVRFRIQSGGNQFKRNDCVLEWVNQERKPILLARGELEYAADQNKSDSYWQNWDYEIPRLQMRLGLSLLMRKNYDDNFGFFLRMSPTRHSAYIVDTRNNFVSKTKDAETELVNDSINKQFENTKSIYAFDWTTVDKNSFLFENKKLIQNGNFCLIEDDQWKLAHTFFYERYFPLELKNEIKFQQKIVVEQQHQDELRNQSHIN